jgi:hypothetical protein
VTSTVPLHASFGLPAAPAGWFDYGYAVLADGNLAMLRANLDFYGEDARWRAEAAAGRHLAAPPALAGRELRLTVFDGAAESMPLRIASPDFPIVDRLQDGRWLLAAARAETGAENGQILHPDGTQALAFVAGDGIGQATCAPDGTFWIGYFDEGVFGGPNPDGSWPVSSAGLAQFSAEGEVLWRFNSDDERGLVIDDCYALSLSGSTAWICPYRGFPIIRIDRGKVACWRNEVHGARALAVEGDLVLLAGGPNADRLALVRLQEREARLVGELKLPALAEPGVRLVAGRNEMLHIVRENMWTRICVDDVRRCLGA